ncbi:glycerate kinase [Tessaracoccus sp.]
MRVLVAADAMAGLDPRGASEVIARAFADLGAQVAVVPLSDGGPWFAGSVAAFDDTADVLQPTSLAGALEAVTSPPPTRYVDLTNLAPHTWDELIAVQPEVLASLRAASAGRGIVGIVRSGTQRATLTGLTGAVAERGRRDGTDLADTLSADTRVSRWCDAIGVSGDVPGSGAAEGVGAVIVALGGRISSGIEVCVDGFDMASTMAKADLTVTGSAVLDFHAVGGDVVKEVARLAGQALRPVIAIVGRNFVSARELRLAGMESAHPILDGTGDDEPSPRQLADVASKVARSWSW